VTNPVPFHEKIPGSVKDKRSSSKVFDRLPLKPHSQAEKVWTRSVDYKADNKLVGPSGSKGSGLVVQNLSSSQVRTEFPRC